MNRVRDYGAFAIGYYGLGYILLWPLSSPYATGELFGAAVVCGAGAFVPVRWLCGLPHPLQLSMPLHLLGLMSALLVAARLAVLALARLRRRSAAAVGAGAPAGCPPETRRDPSRPRPPRRLGRVKPRAQFGLRGMPH